MKTILAIDPGASGGIAYRNSDGTVMAVPMPETEGEIRATLCVLVNTLGGQTPAFIEDQCGVVGPGMRVSASSMFSFGRNFGFILGTLAAYTIRVELVRPQKWQKFHSLGTKKDAGKDWKAKLRGKAQQLYPHLKATLKTADALLLLDYGIRWVTVADDLGSAVTNYVDHHDRGVIPPGVDPHAFVEAFNSTPLANGGLK